MSTKNFTFTFASSKNSFQAFFDVFDYRSVHNVTSNVVTEVDGDYFKFKSVKTVEYPAISTLGQKVMSSFPSKIMLDFKGTMHTSGKGVIITSLSNDYVKFRETVKFSPEGNIDTTVEYRIIPQNDGVGMLSYFMNSAYNSAVSLIENQVIDLYMSRKNSRFIYANPKVVTSYEDLVSVIKM